jgi:pimeloyl-ACP methyl ester carboxylesterase
MPKVAARDGTRLYLEEVGAGTPVVFVHEYAGDYRSWEPQMRFLCRQHRCVTYSQRGYSPSDVPSDPSRYSQDIACDDVLAVMDALKRPPLWEMEPELKRLSVPLLVVVGDEDDLCFDGSVFLKRSLPTAALLVIPRAGHTINSEDPGRGELRAGGAVLRRRSRPLARP